MTSNYGRQSNLRVCRCYLGIHVGYEVAKWLPMMGAIVIFVFVVVL